MSALEASHGVAVVGSGTMGAGIAQVALTSGHPVLLHDVDTARAEQAVAGIGERLDQLVQKGRMDATARTEALERLEVAKELEDLSGVRLVVEAAVESLEIKRDLFRRLEDVCGDATILATNTSTISVTAIGAAMRRPERLVGMHFFNPAPLMRLVEVVSGLATDPAVAETVYETAQAWGKVAVHVASTPGFIVNRVARPFYGEALRVYEERGAEPATIDAVLRESGGFRMGPFELMDLIGLDVNLAASTSVWQAFHNDPRYTPTLAQRELVDSGRLGRKTGYGWYAYDGSPSPQPATAAPAPPPNAITVHPGPEPLTSLLSRLSNAGVDIVERPEGVPGIQLTAGGVMRVTDGRLATVLSAELDRPVVLVDLALDFATTSRLAVAGSDGCPQPVLDEAVGLLQAAGAAVSIIDDVPGLLVARTVAMLVNEAADMVGRGVASASSVDAAMRYGVNYPVGPLEWGDRLGASYVVRVLDNLAQTYGDGRYRVTPWLRRRALTGRSLHDD
jgi:3-hydroxybutyryl-CoA dehydrogenase